MKDRTMTTSKMLAGFLRGAKTYLALGIVTIAVSIAFNFLMPRKVWAMLKKLKSTLIGSLPLVPADIKDEKPLGRMATF